MPGRDVGETNGGSTDRLLGELIAEIRALKHSENNTSSMVQSVSRKVEPIPHLIQQVADLRTQQDKHNFRLGVLEADKNRREGAVGLVEWVSKHWPFTVLGALILAFVAWANGKFGH